MRASLIDFISILVYVKLVKEMKLWGAFGLNYKFGVNMKNCAKFGAICTNKPNCKGNLKGYKNNFEQDIKRAGYSAPTLSLK